MECDNCNKRMLDDDINSCTKKHIMINGIEYKRDNKYFDVGSRCHDCNIKNVKGNYHHLGCDIERCPCCKGQLISCDCDKET